MLRYSSELNSSMIIEKTNGVVRSLYRRLLKEVAEMDRTPLLKTLFPCPKEIQTHAGIDALYIPNSLKYTVILRNVFRDPEKNNLKLGFDVLNRLRAHKENIQDRLPEMRKNHNKLNGAINRASKDSKFESSSAAVGGVHWVGGSQSTSRSIQLQCRSPGGPVRRGV